MTTVQSTKKPYDLESFGIVKFVLSLAREGWLPLTKPSLSSGGQVHWAPPQNEYISLAAVPIAKCQPLDRTDMLLLGCLVPGRS